MKYLDCMVPSSLCTRINQFYWQCIPARVASGRAEAPAPAALPLEAESSDAARPAMAPTGTGLIPAIATSHAKPTSDPGRALLDNEGAAFATAKAGEVCLIVNQAWFSYVYTKAENFN
jgi:hypothetical protein